MTRALSALKGESGGAGVPYPVEVFVMWVLHGVLPAANFYELDAEIAHVCLTLQNEPDILDALGK